MLVPPVLRLKSECGTDLPETAATGIVIVAAEARPAGVIAIVTAEHVIDAQCYTQTLDEGRFVPQAAIDQRVALEWPRAVVEVAAEILARDVTHPAHERETV